MLNLHPKIQNVTLFTQPHAIPDVQIQSEMGRFVKLHNFDKSQ